jgi:murein L,D-transpeptidase YcbB/YkuD
MLNYLKHKNYYFFFISLFSFLLFYSAISNKSTLPRKAIAEERLINPLLVNKFYQLNNNRFIWFSTDTNSKHLRKQLLFVLDTFFEYGSIKKAYHATEIKKWADTSLPDSLLTTQTEKIFTDAALAAFKDIFQGYFIKPGVGFDAISSAYADKDDEFILNWLLQVHSARQLMAIAELLEPKETEYMQLKTELKLQKEKNDKAKIQQLITSMNYFRWVHHFRAEKFIVINIPSAYLRYYEHDSMKLMMKTILGKKTTPTPRFAAYFNEVILYPYWYVPASIIFNELLPKIKRNPSILDAMNIQVVDGSGKILNPHKINWSSFNSGYFPYRLRQSTGCDNSLGVIKFNINSPYGVYLHDTNNKTAFLSGFRFYSHGCIRLEEPINLGNLLLHDKLDTTFLQSCFKEQKPVSVLLDSPIPVFVIYMLAETDPAGKVRYYKDIYNLF